jgi:hypothetical protein
VVSALVRYSIDSNTSVTEAEEVVREVAQPLVEAIAGNRNATSFVSTSSNLPVAMLRNP